MALLSTRGQSAPISAPQAILKGLAPDGGLFVPERFETLSLGEILSLQGASYVDWAKKILGILLPEYEAAPLADAIQEAYDRFDDPDVVPVVDIGENTYVMELFHGPTLAFKDVALQLLPHLSALSKEMERETRELFVLVATSGDTGKAALEGFMDVPGTRCAVFFPEEGVSEAQRLQMLTQPGSNTHVIAVEGNFDDTQNGVKRIFQDAALARQMDASGRMLTSANSINFGRLVPQVVYYFYAYAQMLQTSEMSLGDPVHFAVPTGNFGNILAAYYARQMGLPIGRLLCASNANHVLADFLETGVYDTHRPFQATLSPSMDILISSNLERLLFELSGREPATVRGWMEELRTKGRYEIGPERLEALRSVFTGGWADDGQTRAQIRRVFEKNHYLLDPHTAVASAVLDDYRAKTGDPTPCVLLATASPFKFGRAVLGALGGETGGLDDFAACDALSARTGRPVPPQIALLPQLPVLHHTRCAPEDMETALEKILP